MMQAFESSGYIWIANGPHTGLAIPNTPTDVWEYARQGVYDLWLKPDTYARLQRAGGLPDRPFVHALDSTAWPVVRPHEPLTAKPFAALEEALSALKCKAAGPTPSWRGLTLLKRWQARHPERFLIECDGEVPHDAAPNLTKPIGWEPGTRYIHKIDMNAAYLAAARRVTLGAGTLMPAKTLLWQPGIWRVKLGTSINHFHPIPADGWHDASALRVAHEYGQAFELLEGYVWSRQSTALRGWAELLGNTLETLPASKPYIKAIYTRTMGKMGSRAGSNAIWYRHPHWWRAVIGAANLRVWWLALKAPEICGIATDSLIVVTTGTPALPPAVQERLGTKPGQYRHEWTKHLPPPVSRLFGQCSATKIIAEMARYPTLERSVA
jgi:hypothetical protein